MNLVASFEKNNVEFTGSDLPIFIKLFLYISCRLRITMFRPRLPYTDATGEGLFNQRKLKKKI